MARFFLLASLAAAVAGCEAISPRRPLDPLDEAAPTVTRANPDRSLRLACSHKAAPRPTIAEEPVAADQPSDAEDPTPTLLPASQREPYPASKLPSGPEPEPAVESDSLAAAADCLERNDEAGAARHLAEHIAAHPDQIVFRAQLADLYHRLDQLPDAQAQLEAAVAHAQDGAQAARDRLVRFHTRLMEITRARGDEYGEFLHRGIGLYLVAERVAAEGGESSDVERLRFKAIAALKTAQEKRPDDGRAAWYTFQVWERLGQTRPAEKSLRKAVATAPFSAFTEAEARALAVAARPMMGPR